MRSGTDSLVSCCPELTSLAAGNKVVRTVPFMTKMLGLLCWLPVGVHVHSVSSSRGNVALRSPAALVHMKGCCPI